MSLGRAGLREELVVVEVAVALVADREEPGRSVHGVWANFARLVLGRAEAVLGALKYSLNTPWKA